MIPKIKLKTPIIISKTTETRSGVPETINSISETRDNRFQVPIRPIKSNVNLEPYRKKVREQLALTQIKPELISELESNLYHKVCQNQSPSDSLNFHYMSLCRHLIANLKDNNEINNVVFIKAINEGLISLSNAINLSPQDMHTERWKIQTDKKKYKLEQSLKPPVATSTLYKCGRCKQNQATYYQSQDRSSDEGFTTHLTCVNCGNKWRQ